MRFAWILVGLGLVVGFFQLPGGAAHARQDVDLEAVHQQLIDALNAGDVDAALALFTDDATLEAPLGPIVGKEELRFFFAGAAEGGVTLTVLSREVSGDTLTARVEAPPPFPVPGVERVVFIDTLQFSDGKISLQRNALDPTDEQTVSFIAALEGLVTDVYQQLVDALNAGDVDGVLAQLTDNAVFETASCTPCSGKEEIRAFIEGSIADKLQLTITGTSVSGRGEPGVALLTVSAQWEAVSDSIESTGVERIVGTDTSEFSGPVISRLVSELDLTDEQTAAFVDAISAPPPAELPASGGPPSSGESAFAWWYALAAVSGTAALAAAALTLGLRRRRARTR